MKKCEPFQFRKLLVAYNLLHVLLSVYIFWEMGMSGWFGKYSLRCEPFDPSLNPATMRVRLDRAKIE